MTGWLLDRAGAWGHDQHHPLIPSSSEEGNSQTKQVGGKLAAYTTDISDNLPILAERFYIFCLPVGQPQFISLAITLMINVKLEWRARCWGLGTEPQTAEPRTQEGWPLGTRGQGLAVNHWL